MNENISEIDNSNNKKLTLQERRKVYNLKYYRKKALERPIRIRPKQKHTPAQLTVINNNITRLKQDDDYISMAIEEFGLYLGFHHIQNLVNELQEKNDIKKNS